MIYTNSQGNSINLNSDPYWLDCEAIRNYEWEYATKDKKRGHIIAGFTKDVKELDLELDIWGLTEEQKNRNIDAFNNLIEIDIYNGVAGTLSDGDWFTYGYFIASENTDWNKGAPMVRKKVTFVREKLSWYHTTRAANFGADSDEQLFVFDEEDIKTFDECYGYGYNYMTDVQSQKTITNPGSVPCDFIINIQGYVDHPILKIGDNIVSVDVEVPYGAHLTIDSTKKTVVMTLIDGTEINCFGARDPDYYLFERIPYGRNVVTWNGSFIWELKLIEERSEPRWHTV